MLTGKQIEGKPLISLTDGKKVGEVKDLYLDETLSQIAGVFVGWEGFLNRKDFAVDRASIQVMGIDAWLVQDANVVLPPAEILNSARFVALNDLRGREIVSEGGMPIGAVDDVLFDPTGKVLGFALGRIQVKGTLAERKSIARAAISTIGGKQSAMTANVGQAEATEIPVNGFEAMTAAFPVQ